MNLNRMIKALLMVVGVVTSIPAFASTLTFASTTDPGSWQVATNIGGVDGQFSSFPTTGFQTATAITNRPGWIANNSTGSNPPYVPGGGWVFFNFQQTFDLTGYDPTTANLQFQWAADDSGEGYAARGTWVPQFSLNGGSLTPWGSGPTYNFGPVVSLTSGFVSGINTINFFVEGNSVTDGFALNTVSFTAVQSTSPSTVPLPAALPLMLSGLGVLGFASRRRKETV